MCNPSDPSRHQGYRICPLATAQVLGLVVRDAPQEALLTMRVYYCAAEQDLILRSPPKAGVSKDGHEHAATKSDSLCAEMTVQRVRVLLGA
ncbi:hypothetical protein J2R76_004355 [Bradyrhizobium sp. USDA 4532]|nr:hypothetical protein [Bradyrhizobium sp. USDA 4545]MCP1920764.1 hypothetical protein [Bradyrhizobium sp. USDA 4532]